LYFCLSLIETEIVEEDCFSNYSHYFVVAVKTVELLFVVETVVVVEGD
jgi:hypothetical protein